MHIVKTNISTDLIIDGDGYFLLWEPSHGSYSLGRSVDLRHGFDSTLISTTGLPILVWDYDENNELPEASFDTLKPFNIRDAISKSSATSQNDIEQERPVAMWIDSDGKIMMHFSNSITKAMAKIPIVALPIPSEAQGLGNGSYCILEESVKDLRLKYAGDEGVGAVVSGMLEVDPALYALIPDESCIIGWKVEMEQNTGITRVTHIDDCPDEDSLLDSLREHEGLMQNNFSE